MPSILDNESHIVLFGKPYASSDVIGLGSLDGIRGRSS